MKTKKQIAQEVAEENEYKCPGINGETVEFCVDSVIETMKNIMYDDTDDTVGFKIYGFGSIVFDYYTSMSKIKEEKIQKSKHYKATYHKHSVLKNFKKDEKGRQREHQFADPILKRFYKKLTKKRVRYIHSNFYNYWKELALNHNQNHN